MSVSDPDFVILPEVCRDVKVVYGPWDSSSDKTGRVKHYTFETQGGTLKCTCEGWMYRQSCKHTTAIRDHKGEEEADFDVSL
jgi:hypothetical protein